MVASVFEDVENRMTHVSHPDLNQPSRLFTTPSLHRANLMTQLIVNVSRKAEHPFRDQIKQAMLEVMDTFAYQDWIERRTQSLQMASVKSKLNRDEVLKHFKCPLTNTIAQLPVVCPNGVTFEYEAIVRWLEQNPGKVAPECTVAFTEEELVFDCSYFNTIQNRLETINERLTKRDHAEVVAFFQEQISINQTLASRLDCTQELYRRFVHQDVQDECNELELSLMNKRVMRRISRCPA
ncbi:MAG: hypothetical protein H0X51_00620 [Parachlamydiaceae bacterium]|nr:hypothetical protein [Parachlamydiaceae bacterium]